ncbi:Uncharacterised protein [Burkholderia pseudomallei]|nr:Uncharacterised protein [Burkholderia pseudomallei]
MPQTSTFVVIDAAIIGRPVFGYGTGTGPPGVGVLQTSAGLRHRPDAVVTANILELRIER